MTENTTTAKANSTTAKAEDVKSTEPTKEELAKAFASIPGPIQEAITNLNKAISEHNANVDRIKNAEQQDTALIKADIFEQNKSSKKLVTLRTEYVKLCEKLESLKDQAYKVIDDEKLMPKSLTEDELTKLKAQTTESTKTLRDQSTALITMETILPGMDGKLGVHLTEIKTRRGAAKTGGTTSKGEGPKRPRFKRIEINGVIEDGKGNTVYGMIKGEQKFTFTLAAQYLNKQHKGINWGSSDLAEAYFAGQDEANMPEVHEFEMPYTFTTDGNNEETIIYKVKAYR